jgi:hypothetical protein
MAKVGFARVTGATVVATAITPDPLARTTQYTTSDILNASNVSGSTLTDALNALNTGKQNADPTLSALAGLTTSANTLILCTGADTFTVGHLADAYVSPTAAIARTKLASGTASVLLSNNGSGVMADSDLGYSVGVITRSGGLQLPANIGIGTAVNTVYGVNYALTVADQTQSKVGQLNTINSSITVNNAFANAGYNAAITLTPAVGTTYTAAITGPQRGYRCTLYNNGAGTVDNMVGMESWTGQSGTGGGVTTYAVGLRGILNRAGTGTVSTWKGLELVESGSTASITNYWGLYEDLGTGAKNYLKNALLIGTISLLGTETFRNNGSTVLGDISIGAADGVITRSGGLQLPANIGIGTAVGASALAVSGSTEIRQGVGSALSVGADATGATITNSTLKAARVTCPHYLTAEENIAIFSAVSSSTDNTVQIGGGTTTANCASLITFWTAANYNTLIGLERMRLTSGGSLLIGTTALLGTETFRNNGATVLGDISIGASDGVITRSAGLQLPANIGIGTAVNTAQSITFQALYTDTAATRTLSQGAYSMTTTTSQTANIRGYAIGLTLAPAIGTTNSTSSTSSPFYATAYLNGAGTASQLNGLTLFVGLDSAGTGTITASNSLDIYCRRAAAGTIITWKGLNLSESGSSGTITNYWGLYESLGTGAKNYLAHALLIGTTALVGSELLRVQGGSEAAATATDLCFGNGVLSIGGRLRQAGCFAGIHVHDASTAQTIATGASYTKSTAFTDNDPAANATSDAANDKITLTKTGYYRVWGSISFTTNTNNVVVKAAAFLNGVEQDSIHCERKIGTGADIGSMSFVGTIDATTAPWDLDMRLAHDYGSDITVTVKYANLSVEYIGET